MVDTLILDLLDPEEARRPPTAMKDYSDEFKADAMALHESPVSGRGVARRCSHNGDSGRPDFPGYYALCLLLTWAVYLKAVGGEAGGGARRRAAFGRLLRLGRERLALLPALGTQPWSLDVVARGGFPVTGRE